MKVKLKSANHKREHVFTLTLKGDEEVMILSEDGTKYLGSLTVCTIETDDEIPSKHIPTESFWIQIKSADPKEIDNDVVSVWND